MIKKMLILIVCLLLFTSFSGCIEETPFNGSKTVIYVGGSEDADYRSIQDAIDVASNGSTIFVRNGTYSENLQINMSITLIGASRDKTIISPNKITKIGYLDAISIDADNCTIKELKLVNTIDAVKYNGINIKSSNNTISNNTIVGFTEGIHIAEESKSNNNNIQWNNISGNDEGIRISQSFGNIISNNTISSNKIYGIYLSWKADESMVFENIISDNNCGIRIKSSKNNLVFKNSIINNSRGIYCCCGANYNRIYNNTFEKNTEVNAKEGNGLNNYWNSHFMSGRGNYWDDYTGIDSNGDGIGDTPYYINDSGNQDNFPLMNPV